MSSLRNAINRRTHKERAQPLERKRFGLLEKHKDYSLRAADYNKKKKTLSNLRAKTAEKNEDEFSYKMLSRSGPGSAITRGKKWTGTVDGDRGNRPLDMNTVRLLKTQDMATLRMYRSTAAKEVTVLEERVVGLGGSLDFKSPGNDESDEDEWADEEPSRKKPRKIVFVDGVEEREQMLLDEANKAVDEDDGDDGGDDDQATPESLRAEQRRLLLLKLQRRLVNARKKLSTLATAENELDMQRARMAKTATVGGVTKSGKKFKVRERKR